MRKSSMQAAQSRSGRGTLHAATSTCVTEWAAIQPHAIRSSLRPTASSGATPAVNRPPPQTHLVHCCCPHADAVWLQAELQLLVQLLLQLLQLSPLREAASADGASTIAAAAFLLAVAQQHQLSQQL
jgi:hypothetical protein